MITKKTVYLVIATDHREEWYIAYFDTKDEALKEVKDRNEMFKDCDHYILEYVDNGSLEVGYIRDLFHCKGCRTIIDVYDRHDYYGIFTGHYCDYCYENNYPYRKDRYPTMEYDGYGDYLEDDY